MSRRSKARGGKAASTSSAVDSPARTSALPERAKDSAANAAAYSSSSSGSFARFDPASSTWRTRQLSLFGGWTEYWAHWPRSGSMRNGAAFRRPVLELIIDAIGGGASLTHKIPTPTVGDAKSSGSRNTASSAAHPGVTLTDFVRQDGGTGRLPSPAARDWRSGKGRKPNGHTPQLVERIEADAAPTMRLNPDWVERLMGWPDGWTDLPPTGPETGSTECPASPHDESTE